MCPNTEFSSGPYFPAFGLNTERYDKYLCVFNPNAGKYGPEKTPYLDTSHAVGVFSVNFAVINFKLVRAPEFSKTVNPLMPGGSKKVTHT